AFAGNTLLVNPERLFADGWLSQSELEQVQSVPDAGVDFGRAHEIKDQLLALAFARYQRTTDTEFRREFETFAEQNASWLTDYALFRALKTEHDGKPWHEWEPTLVRREAAAILAAKAKLHGQIEAHKFAQFLFFRQWFELKAYCNQRGISLIGDVPISWRRILRMFGPIRSSSSSMATAFPQLLPAYRPTTSARPASTGEIRSTTGTACWLTGSSGGSSACGRLCGSWISRASITFADSPPAGKFPVAILQPNVDVGSRCRAGNSLRRSEKPSEICRSSPRTSA